MQNASPMTFLDEEVAEARVCVSRLVHFPLLMDCRERPIEAFSTVEQHCHRSKPVARRASPVFSPDSNRAKPCQQMFVHWVVPVGLEHVVGIEEEQR